MQTGGKLKKGRGLYRNVLIRFWASPNKTWALMMCCLKHKSSLTHRSAADLFCFLSVYCYDFVPLYVCVSQLSTSFTPTWRTFQSRCLFFLSTYCTFFTHTLNQCVSWFRNSINPLDLTKPWWQVLFWVSITNWNMTLRSPRVPELLNPSY